MRKFLSVIFCFAIVIISLIPAFSVEYGRLLVDDIGLLDTTESEETEERLEEISENYNINIVIKTTDNLEGKTDAEYADDYFDYNGYGEDGVLLLIYYKENNEGNNKIYISTKGTGIKAFSDSDIDYCLDGIYNAITYDGFYEAFVTFCNCCNDEYENLVNGTSDDGIYKDYDEIYGDYSYNTSGKLEIIGKRIIISLIIGLVASFIVTSAMTSKLKSVRSQSDARNYVNPGSMKITSSSDILLYTDVQKREKPKDPPPSSGGSSHTSSSGSSHGGGGRSF